MNRKDETGNRYGRLVVGGYAFTKNKGAFWKCRCDCGNETTVMGTHLRNGDTRSCGCLSAEMAKDRLIGKRGKDCMNWKRGWTFDGRYIVHQRPDHPNADKYGHVYEHVLIMEAMLGRCLEKGEYVHHCNFNKLDNRPYNLRLFGSNQEHLAYHAKLRREPNGR